MPHYIVEITYRVPLTRIEETVPSHRAHLQTGYDRGLLLASGPQVPRSGGILIARAPTREALESFIAQDPYRMQDLADYRLIEFQPVKYQPWAADWFGGS
ncbi:MAG TPA: YciI family protein [Nevskia sp.]|nr:YciI family protein [Nevskia sp.]